MDTEKFQSQLKAILPLILTYGSDFFGLTEENFSKNPKEIHGRDFVNKCHEGFKQAQKVIISNLLELEQEIKSAKRELKNFIAMNPHHPQNLPEYKAIEEKIRGLEFQGSSFREAANVMAWNMLGFDQPNIKMFAQANMHQGHISDQNLKSVSTIADEINADENSFALINDLTSILGVGDLLIAQNGRVELAEVKEGRINELISKLIEENLHNDPEVLNELSKAHGSYIADQIKRFGKQKETMDAVIEYMNTGIGKDFVFGVFKNKYEVKAETDTYIHLLHSAIDKFYTDRKLLLVPVDFGWIGIFDKTGKSEFVCALDFMHYLYHTITKPWEQCDYLKTGEQHYTLENPPEMFIYEKTPIYLVKNKVRVLSHQPLFLTLKSEYAIDLLADKLGLYVYFDVDQFIKICETNGLQTGWLTQSQLDKFDYTKIKNFIPKFDDKYLQLEYKGNASIFSYGYLYRLVYEFQSGQSLVEQIKEVMGNRSKYVNNKIDGRFDL